MAELKRGDRVVVDVWCLETPMLDKEGNPRSSWKGPLTKYGYTKKAGTIKGFGNKLFGSEETIMIRYDGISYDLKMKPEEPAGSCAHTHRAGSIRLETEQDICDMAQIPSESDLGVTHGS